MKSVRYIGLFSLLACGSSPVDNNGAPPDDTDFTFDSIEPVDSDPGGDSDLPDDTADTDVAPIGPCDLGAAAYIGAATYVDLMTAYRAAVDGDTVFICPGAWEAGDLFEFTGRLVLAGATGNASDVVLLPSGPEGRALWANGVDTFPHPDLELRDLELQGDAWLVGQGPATATRGSSYIDNVIFRYNGRIVVDYFNSVEISNVSNSQYYTSPGGTKIHIRWAGDSIIFRDSTIRNDLYTGNLVSIFRSSTLQSNLNILFQNITFENLTGDGGQLINLSLEGGSTSVNFDHVTFANNNGGTFLGGEWNSVGAITLFTRYNDAADVDVHITDCVFDNNQGDDAGVLRVNLNRDFGGSTTVDIRDTIIHRSSWSPGFELMPGFPGPELAGPAIRTDTGTQTTLTNVDFGVGPNENYALDLLHCPDYEGVVSGYYERTTSTQFCP